MNTVFSALALLSSLSIIISVTLQEGSSGGMGAITGASEPLWGQSRGKSKEDVLKRVTIVSAVVFIIAHLALTIIK